MTDNHGQGSYVWTNKHLGEAPSICSTAPINGLHEHMAMQCIV